MKISEIKGEQALDVLVDLVEPISTIVQDKIFVQKLKSGDKIGAIRQGIKEHKKEVIEILAILDCQDPETYEVSLVTLPFKILEILNDEEFVSLFQSQGQTAEKTSSTSATGTIKDNAEGDTL